MAQLAYGSITITDTNDIESIVIEYAQSNSSSTAPTSGWDTIRPEWEEGKFVWQRTRIHKSGTQATEDTYGTAVCITGSTGSTGRGVQSTTTQYAISNSTSSAPSTGWQNNVPAYDSTKPNYWVKVTTTYTSGNPSVVTYLDAGLTSATSTAAEANSTASAANTTAGEAKQIAEQASTDVSNLTTTYSTFINTRAKYFIHNSTGSIVIGSREGETPAVSFDENTISTYGYNALMAPARIALRYNDNVLSSWSSSALTFYKPNSTNKSMELTSSNLNFYGSSQSTPDAQLTSTGLKLVKGGINVGQYSSTATDSNQNFIYISSADYGSAVSTLHNTKTDWRVLIGNKFGVDKAGNLYASNVNISGAITATSLSLGDNVKVDYSKINNTPDLSIYISKNGVIGTEPSDSAASSNTGFKVSSAGLLKAANAVITGKIFASSGTIGGWNIGTDTNKSLYYGNFTPGYNTTNLVLSPSSATNTNAIGGSATGLSWFISAGRVFGVTTGGALYSTSGKIGGFTIGTTNLYNNKASLTDSKTGIFISTTGIAGGAGDSWWIKSDGTFQFGGANGVTYNGSTLSLPAANITGDISADRMKVNSISAINSNTGTVKISASKVEIDGTATFNAIKSSTDAAYDAKGSASAAQTAAQGYADTAISNIEIGGRNLICQSRFSSPYWIGGVSHTVENEKVTITGAGEFYQRYSEATPVPQTTFGTIPAGTTLTLSCYFYENTISTGNHKIYYAYSPSWLARMVPANFTGLWHDTFTTTADITGLCIDFDTRGATDSTIKWVCGPVKLEIGNKVTGWTPAPEDAAMIKSTHTLDTSYSYTYGSILTYATEGRSDTWHVVDKSGVLIGDTVRIKCNVSDMNNAPVYVVGTVTAVDANSNQLTVTSHGLDTTIIDGGNILTNSIGANQIKANAITADKLAANSITVGKMDAETQAMMPWTSDVESVPYLLRQSAGGTIDHDFTGEYDKIVGGTVAWNQRAEDGNFATGTNWKIYNGSYGSFSASGNIGTITYSQTNAGGYNVGLTQRANTVGVIGAHKYFIQCDVKPDFATSMDIELGTGLGKTRSTTVNAWTTVSWIEQRPYGTGTGLIIKPVNSSIVSGSTIQFKNVMVCDLTQMFGSTIADYIYNLETTTAGAGVAFFKKLFPNDYYAYDAGTLRSVEGLSEHRTVGFNQWDEKWELGGYDTAGIKSNSTNEIRNKNLIPVIPNTKYYFNSPIWGVWYAYDAEQKFISRNVQFSVPVEITTPANCRYISFYLNNSYGTTYKNDICINISDASKNGTYEPYHANSYPLDSSLTLRGIPKLNGNNLYYDGDTYESDGTVTRKYGIVDLGTLNWTYIDGEAARFQSTFAQAKPPAGGSYIANLLCPMYSADSTNNIYTHSKDKTIGIHTGQKSFWVYNSAYTDAATFKSAMSGVYLVYELATPTTETATSYASPQAVIPQGTEEYVTTGIVPVGHETTYASGSTVNAGIVASTQINSAIQDTQSYTDDVTSTLSDSLTESISQTSTELSGKIDEVRTLANSKADSSALNSLSLQMQEYIGEGGYIYANNGTLIIATGQNIGNFKIGLTGQQIVFYENDVAVAYIEGKKMYITRSEVTDEQKISNFAFKKRDGGRFTLMYVGG